MAFSNQNIAFGMNLTSLNRALQTVCLWTEWPGCEPERYLHAELKNVRIFTSTSSLRDDLKEDFFFTDH